MTKQAAIQSKFYDPTGIVPEQMKLEFKKDNANQDREILGIFYMYPHKEFTPLMIEDECKRLRLGYEIVSIRRALNTLMNCGKIIVTGSIIERKGRPNQLYRLKPRG